MIQDLKNIFSTMAPLPDDDKPVVMLVCDVYGTLLPDNQNLDRDLHDFLLALKEKGAGIVIASAQAEDAVKALQDAGCDPLLIKDGVRDKIKVQHDLDDAEINYAAIDDTAMWFDAAICIHPGNKNFRNIIEAGPR